MIRISRGPCDALAKYKRYKSPDQSPDKARNLSKYAAAELIHTHNVSIIDATAAVVAGIIIGTATVAVICVPQQTQETRQIRPA